MKTNYDVIIIGGGVVGSASAFYLSNSGASVAIIEKDSIASHASGFAYGGITPTIGLDPNSSYHKISRYSYKLHTLLADVLPHVSGIDYGFRIYPNIDLAINDMEKDRLSEIYNNFSKEYEWCDRKDLEKIDSRLGPNVISGLISKSSSGLDPYKFSLSLLTAAEKKGAKFINSKIDELIVKNYKVKNVVLTNGTEIFAKDFIIAAGPWSNEFSKWFGNNIPIRPLKGQIIRLKSDQKINLGFHWGSNYVTSKQDGLIWAGTTEEDVGFDEIPTLEARNEILSSVVEIFPFLEDSQLIHQTACLRPLTVDKLPIISQSNIYNNLFIGSGAGRQGILLGPGMGKILSDLITSETSEIDIKDFSHLRFS